MRLFDEKFFKHPSQYLVQFGLVTISILIVLLFLHTIYSATIVASLGASSFIAFTVPHAQSARPRYLIGGYFAGTIVGLAFNAVRFFLPPDNSTLFGYPAYLFLGALAVGFAMFTMVIMNFEHPPAAALALGLVIDPQALYSAMIAVIGIIALSIIKTFLKPYLKNLL